jgi:hypothetical protein
MFAKKVLLVLVVHFSLIIPSQVSAWDGQRKGFIFGVGGGAAINRTTSAIGNTSESNNYTGMNVAARIGYATSNNLGLYVFDNISIFDETFLDSVPKYFLLPFGEQMVVEKQLTHFEIGIGASYYFEEAAPSFFLEGGFGFCNFGDAVFQDEKTGVAYDLAAGYEFSRHWSAKLEFLGATAGYDNYMIAGKKSTIYTFIFTVNVLGY